MVVRTWHDTGIKNHPKLVAAFLFLTGILLCAGGLHNLGLLDSAGFNGWGISEVLAVIQIVCAPAFIFASGRTIGAAKKVTL